MPINNCFTYLPFSTEDELEIIISTAIKNAHTTWEKKFMRDIHDSYVLHGLNIYIKKRAADKLMELQVPYNERKTKLNETIYNPRS